MSWGSALKRHGAEAGLIEEFDWVDLKELEKVDLQVELVVEVIGQGSIEE